MSRIIRSVMALIVVGTMLGLSGCGYNSIQVADEATKSAWGEVVNQYKRRADLIPSLVNTVKGFADQERDVLTAVTEARARASSIQVNPSDPASLKQFEQAQSGVNSALSRLLVTVENYPQLKSDANFRDLQAQLEGTENRSPWPASASIESIEAYNVMIRQVPTNLTAMVFGYKPKPQFTVEDEQAIQTPPTVDFERKPVK
ncbi:MAG: LemA family protein [Burkholderiaceae bacterium]